MPLCIADAGCALHSLGVVLWEIATGEVPIRGSIVTPQVPGQCPAEVAQIVQECMRRDPAARPTPGDVFRCDACLPFLPLTMWGGPCMGRQLVRLTCEQRDDNDNCQGRGAHLALRKACILCMAV